MLASRCSFVVFFLLSLCVRHSHQLPQSEQASLEALYAQCGGSEWARAKNWLHSPNACDWEGVVCEPETNSTVIHLLMSRNNLVCDFPPALEGLKGLTILDLSENSVSGTLPSWIGSLSNLEELYLGTENTPEQSVLTNPVFITLVMFEHIPVSTNSIYGPVPSSIQNCSKLRIFRAEYTDFDYLPPELGSLTLLEDFRITFSSLSGDFPAWIGNWTNLHTLTLSGSEYGGVFPPEWASLTQLLVFMFSFSPSRVPAESMDVFKHWTKLMHIELDGCAIHGTLPESIGTLRNLISVVIATNDLSGTVPEAFWGIPTLDALYISGNPHLTGTIPATIGQSSSLTILSIDGTGFTGSLPDEFYSLESLMIFKSSYTPLSGTISPLIGNLRNLVAFDINDGNFTGEFPVANVSGLPLLNFRIQGNSFTGDIGAFSFPELENFDASRNQFTGTPNFLCSFTKAVIVRSSENLLTGTLPSCLSQLTSLEDLRLSGNKITGTLPAEIGSLTSLKKLDLSRNSFSGGAPNSWDGMTGLEALILHSNPLRVTLGGVLMPLRWLPRLAIIDVSDCQLSGNLDSFIFYDATRVLFPSTHSFIFDRNQIGGPLQDAIPDLPSLQTLSISFNNLVDEIPFSHQFLRSLFVQGNTGMKSKTNSLPSFLRPVYENRLSDASGFWCPDVGGATKEMQVKIDFSYYNYSLCECSQGFQGTPPNCVKTCSMGEYGIAPNCSACLSSMTCPGGLESVGTCRSGYFGVSGMPPVCHPCPSNAVCPGHVTTPTLGDGDVWAPIVVDEGYYPLPSFEAPFDQWNVTSCQNFMFLSKDETSCNPSALSPGTAYKCRPGYDERFCSRCTYGYFRASWKCQECSPIWGLFPAIGAVVFVGMVAFLVWRKPEADRLSTGLVKSFFFFVQVISEFMSGSLAWPINLSALGQSRAVFGFSPVGLGILCFQPEDISFEFQFYFTLVLPVFFAILALALYVVGLLKFRTPKEKRFWKGRCIFICSWLVDQTFFPVASNTLSILSCAQDPQQPEAWYFRDAPYLSCSSDTNANYSAMLGFSILALIFYWIGLPALFCFVHWRLRRDSLFANDFVMESFGFTFLQYHNDQRWFEILVVLRRWALSLVLGLFSLNSPVRAFLLFAVILLALLAQCAYRPYAHRVTNWMEVISLFLAGITYVVGTFTTNSLFADVVTPLSTFVVVVNIVVAFIYVVVIVVYEMRLETPIRRLLRIPYDDPRSPKSPNAPPGPFELNDVKIAGVVSSPEALSCQPVDDDDSLKHSPDHQGVGKDVPVALNEPKLDVASPSGREEGSHGGSDNHGGSEDGGKSGAALPQDVDKLIESLMSRIAELEAVNSVSQEPSVPATVDVPVSP